MNARPRFLALLAFLMGASLTLGSDWPRFLGPDGTGVSSETGLLELFPSTGPEKLWSKSVGTGYSAPSVMGKQLVLHHRQGSEEIVQSLDAVTGEETWRHSSPVSYVDPYGYNNGPRCTPLLTPEFCYTYGVEGRLLCLERAGGFAVGVAGALRSDCPAAHCAAHPFGGYSMLKDAFRHQTLRAVLTS